MRLKAQTHEAMTGLSVAASPDFLQSVMDHPKVRPWIGPDGVEVPLDLGVIFDQGIALEFETGGFFFHRLGDGVMEVHTLFLPGSRDVLSCCKVSAQYLFTATECLRIVTKVPADNIPADRLTQKAGFRHDYTRPNAYLRGGKLHDVRHYSLDFDNWITANGLERSIQKLCADAGQPIKGRIARYRHAVMNDDYKLLE